MLYLYVLHILQIVCGAYSNGEVPELLSEAEEVVLNVVSFSNHQQYDPTKGPINGYDIAVYKVDDQPLRASGIVSKTTIWPICFPKKDYLAGVPGILAGWRDPRPSYFSLNNFAETAKVYRIRNLETRQVRMEQMAKCEDPAWMKIPSPGTFYPAGVVCARDPSGASCLQFGNSGSGLMRATSDTLGAPTGTPGWEVSVCTRDATRPPRATPLGKPPSTPPEETTPASSHRPPVTWLG